MAEPAQHQSKMIKVAVMGYMPADQDVQYIDAQAVLAHDVPAGSNGSSPNAGTLSRAVPIVST